MKLRKRKVINLALQGGGAHGAFTWGVLDRLLEDERLTIEGISATSSGAINAVALAYGLTIDGREGARRLLADLWDQVGITVPGYTPATNVPRIDRTLALEGALALTRVFSPYELNPLHLDPLRDIVTRLIDFERLRAACPLKLYIAATQVRTGKLRLFETQETSAEALLASACLPALHQAVEIDGEPYWDGGYAGNPALYPLFYNCDSRDMVIVLLHPLSRPELPTSVSKIHHRTTELSFGTTFLREMRSIAHAKSQVNDHLWSLGHLERRLRRLNAHLIEPDQALAEQDGITKLNNDVRFLTWLRDRGRMQAQAWLDDNFDALGRHSSVDLTSMFL
ncbi:MAG TPA: patatin-like phospholipase family protein [Gammaproteobacteria bacterium]|jgi:NTE family protein|nr:patatin-like phospholipase family protein [Gammaproteobacteria bacterium]HKH19835.1 patatin-like phospholipase family protein [Gammaproteobacteria bacterium]